MKPIRRINISDDNEGVGDANTPYVYKARLNNVPAYNNKLYKLVLYSFGYRFDNTNDPTTDNSII